VNDSSPFLEIWAEKFAGEENLIGPKFTEAEQTFQATLRQILTPLVSERSGLLAATKPT
jgi:hypothetical protein